MLVEFKSDEASQEIGFSASIHYSALPSKKCEEGLDINMKTIQSPNYPDLYDNNMVCKWLISVPLGFHISLKFLHFDVRFFCNFQLVCSTFPIFYYYHFYTLMHSFTLQLEEVNDFLSLHNGGRDDSEMITKLTGTINETRISMPEDYPCSDTCGSPDLKGNNLCNDENNNCGCEWDRGDCCGSDVVTHYCSSCECLDPRHDKTKISIAGNQMFVVFQTNDQIVRKGFHAVIMQG